MNEASTPYGLVRAVPEWLVLLVMLLRPRDSPVTSDSSSPQPGERKPRRAPWSERDQGAAAAC